MKPAVRITIDGNEADPELMRRLSSICVTDEAGIRADMCELEIDASGNTAAPKPGTEFKVWMGYEPSPTYRGRFRVTGWEHSGPPARISVQACAADLTSNLRVPKSRSWHETTIGEIVTAISQKHGLTPLLDAEMQSREIDHIDQQTESDMSFLSRLAKRQGAIFKVGAGRLIFGVRGSATLPDGEAKQAITIQPTDVTQWSMRSGERGDYRSASALYMDHTAGKRRTARAGEEEPCYRDRRLYGSKAEALAAAQANLSDLKRGMRTGDLDMPGMPELFAEARVKLSGFAPDVDGEFSANRVVHQFDSGGYRTILSLETVEQSNAEVS